MLVDSPALAQTSAEPFVIGETIELESQVLNETRRLIIGKPASYETSDDSYPVLYLLDGGNHFHHTTSITRFLAANARIPELLVVGITNTDRSRDLTPPSQEQEDIELAPTHGGADEFLDYISQDLMPWVEENYRTVPHRILVGHSLGGLFAIHALVTDPTVFDAYIAISPSLQWNDQRLVAEAEAFFENTPELNAQLYISAGNEGGALLGGVRKLSGVLDEIAPRGFGWQFTWMPAESHGSVPLPSTHQGLEFVFPDYYLADVLSMFDEQGLDGIKDFYADSRQRLGLKHGIPLSTLNELLVRLFEANRLDDMAMLLEQAPDTYSPPVDELLLAQAWTYLARGYASDNNVEQAVLYYRKLLDQDPENQSAIRALNELGVAPFE